MRYKVLFFFLLLALSLSVVFSSIHAYSQEAKRAIHTSAISLQDGYKIEPVVANLSVPTTAIFDGNDLLIAESGFEKTAMPRVLRIKPDVRIETVVQEGLEGPVTGSFGI